MASKEDIGKLIKKQFEGVEKSPADSLWEKIDGTLQKRERIKRNFFLFFLLIFIIAVSSFLFLDNFSPQTNPDGKYNANEKSTPENGIDKNNSIKNATSSGEDKIYEDFNQIKKESSEQLENEKKISQINQTSQQKRNTSKSGQINVDSNQAEAATYNQQNDFKYTTKEVDSIINGILDPGITEVTPEQLSDSIPVEKNEDNTNKEETIKPSKKWAVTVLGGINSYSSFNNSSLIHHTLDHFNRSGTLDYTYGFALRFDLLDNLAISYGINKTTFSYFTQNIPASNEPEINRIQNYTDLNSSQRISSAELSTFLQNESQTDLLHQTEYIELPFLIRYSLSSNRFGIHTLGGISTYLQNKENLYVQNENGDRLKIGSLNNLTGARFSLNLGVGLYYEISENLLIELNPTFKYSLSKFSSRADGDKPYFIGVFTGLTYKLF
jgi:hypothetical protein